MSWEFVTFLIFGSIAVLLLLGGLVGRRFNRRADGPVVTLFMGGIALAIAVLVLVIGSFTVVGTRKVGIETVFGKPSGDTLSNFLRELQKGRVHDELSDGLKEVVAAVRATGKAGSLTLKLSVSEQANTSMLVIKDDVTVKAPQADRQVSLWFVDREGNVTRTDPAQLQFESMKAVAESTTNIRKEA